MTRLLALTVFVCSLSLVTIAYAHENGASFEVVHDGYHIDVGYSASPITSGTQTRFDFALARATTSEEVVFSDIWLQVRDTETTLFAGGIAHSRIGPTGISYVFPHAGTYTLAARFHDGGTALVEHTFTFEVEEGVATKSSYTTLWWALGGAVVGALLAVLFRRT